MPAHSHQNSETETKKIQISWKPFVPSKYCMVFAVFAGKTAYINNKTNKIFLSLEGTGDHFSQGCYSQLSFSPRP